MSEAIWREKLETLRAGFAIGSLQAVNTRIARLKALRKALTGARSELLNALASDLSKCEAEASMSELLMVLQTLDYFIRSTRKLSRRRRVPLSFFNRPGKGYILPQPRGVVLIVSTWNYPLSLALDPLIGAVAAGNSVMLKLNNSAQASSAVLSKLLGNVFPENEVAVVCDDLAELLNEKFDLIFFTGGRETGRMVAQAAARKLTPTVLELGGKCPCIVDVNANLAYSAKRIVWGKFLNAGQSCVAPDYLLVHHSIKDALMVEIRKVLRDFYGDNPQQSRDYGRIINKFHYERLCNMLDEGRLIAGGERNPDDFFIAPTVVDKVDENGPLMSDEIFGPILPVFEFDTLSDAIIFVNKRPKPLALYYFGRSRRRREKVLRKTSSGGVGVNDVVNWMCNISMPFGGVGDSGVGAYHGQWSFDTFSHLRAVQQRWVWPELPVRFPPFTRWKMALIRFLVK